MVSRVRGNGADGGVGDLDAQVRQFILDADTAPGWIGLPHPANEVDDLRIDRGSPASRTRLPTPERPESSTLPADHRLRTDYDQAVPSFGPHLHETDPEESVSVVESGPLHPSPQNLDLVPQCQDLQAELLTGLKNGDDCPDDCEDYLKHRMSILEGKRWKSTLRHPR